MTNPRKYRAEVMEHVLNILLVIDEKDLLKALPGTEKAIAENFTDGISPGNCAVMIAVGVMGLVIKDIDPEDRARTYKLLGDEKYRSRVFAQIEDPSLLKDDAEGWDGIGYQILGGALIVDEMLELGLISEVTSELWLTGASASLRGLDEDERFKETMFEKFVKKTSS